MDGGPAPHATGRRGRAALPGPTAALGAGLVGLLLVGVLIVLLTSGGSSAPKPLQYGGLPSWLPKPKQRVGRVLRASSSHTAVSVEGEAVSVATGGGKVLATAVGPEVPEEGQFPVPAVTPVTFLVTFASATKAIPLPPSSFELLDERGNIHHPHVTALHGGPAPGHTTPGRTVTLELHDILPTGDGAIVWMPEGHKPLAAWDFTVEID
jgi:hypothetical protein